MALLLPGDELAAPGGGITLQLTLPGSERLLTLKGEVVRVARRGRFAMAGVRFTRMQRSARARLDAFLRRRRKAAHQQLAAG
jgi:hypothetical protein